MGYIFFYYFRVFVQPCRCVDSLLFSPPCFMWTKTVLSCSSLFCTCLLLSPLCVFFEFFFSLNTSHHSYISLPPQLLVGVTTQGRLVSSSPRGGRATTKTPWVVSGSLRPSQEAPSRSALTGSCDSSPATQLWKWRYAQHMRRFFCVSTYCTVCALLCCVTHGHSPFFKQTHICVLYVDKYSRCILSSRFLIGWK